MQSPPISQTEIEARISDHLEELLELWWAEQGASKHRDLELIASALPFPRTEMLRVLDLCCGPGDVGRAIHCKYPNAQIDCVDRDPFLTSICAGVNRRDHVPGKIVVTDLMDDGWQSSLAGDYHVIATVNALHWFDADRIQQLAQDIHQLLRNDGVFLFAEPACAETTFAAGFAEWKSRQPAPYSRENWERFWTRANEILGYDHTKFLGSRDSNRISEEMPVSDWIRLLKNAGFDSIDVLLRDADEVILASSKAANASPLSG